MTPEQRDLLIPFIKELMIAVSVKVTAEGRMSSFESDELAERLLERIDSILKSGDKSGHN